MGQEVKKLDKLQEEKKSAATANTKKKHTIASKFCIHIVDIWCYSYPFYGPKYGRWIFFLMGFPGNLPFLSLCSDFNQKQDKNYNIHNMKHSSIIIYNFKVTNQIKAVHNLNQGVLQGSVFWCPKGLTIDAELFASDGFSYSPWVTSCLQGVFQSFWNFASSFN